MNDATGTGVKEQDRDAVPHLLYEVIGSYEKDHNGFFGSPSPRPGMFWILNQI
jgi:hypothetical protein